MTLANVFDSAVPPLMPYVSASPSGSVADKVPVTAVKVSVAPVFVKVEADGDDSVGGSSVPVIETVAFALVVPPVPTAVMATVREAAGLSEVFEYRTNFATFVATASFTLLPNTRTLSM